MNWWIIYIIFWCSWMVLKLAEEHQNECNNELDFIFLEFPKLPIRILWTAPIIYLAIQGLK